MPSPFRTNPSLGPNLNQVVLKDQSWYDGIGRGEGGSNQVITPQSGDTSWGDDGRKYIWAEVAGGALSPHATDETEVTVAMNENAPRATVSLGAGGWYIMPQSKNGGVASLPNGSLVPVAKGTAP